MNLKKVIVSFMKYKPSMEVSMATSHLEETESSENTYMPRGRVEIQPNTS